MDHLNDNLHWVLAALLIFIIIWIVAFVVRSNKAKVEQDFKSDNKKEELGPAPPRKSNKN